MEYVLIVRVQSICEIVNGIEDLFMYLREFSLIRYKGMVRRGLLGEIRKIDQLLVKFDKSRQLLSKIDIKVIAISDVLTLS